MYFATELKGRGGIMRGSVIMPDGKGPFPTLIFMHGFTVNRIGPLRLYEDLARLAAREGFCVIRYDFYGTGESDGNFNEMMISTEMRDLEDIFAWAKEQPYVDASNIFVGGHSMGGLVAVLTAPKVQPRGLVCWSTAMAMLYQAGMRARTMKGPTENGWDIEGIELSRAYMDEIIGMDFIEMAKGYNGPVLLIHGDKDTDIPVESSYSLKRLYGENCELMVVKGATHLFLSIPWKNMINEASVAFMKRNIV